MFVLTTHTAYYDHYSCHYYTYTYVIYNACFANICNSTTNTKKKKKYETK